MIEWWNSLSTMMRILWAITLSASLIFIIQSVMTFLGADSGSDFDINSDTDVPDGGMLDSADGPTPIDGDAVHGSGMGLLTFRNFVNFFLGFGWSAILLKDGIKSTTLLMLVSIIVGVVLVVLVMLLFKWLSGMQQSGNINVFKAAPGCEGKVYLKIPAARSGFGKVQITINDSVREYEAVTDGDALPTGASIRVVEVISADTLLVEPLESLII
ncbi:MAG: hypothetical protein IKX67_01750 [Bacteroidales bacterium]|nr:hypothetical protein [Bacteroidales bacterium]